MIQSALALLLLVAAATAALACSEDEIHRQTVACYNQCISTYFQEPGKSQCIQQCVNDQDAYRANCPSITCKIVAGHQICT